MKPNQKTATPQKDEVYTPIVYVFSKEHVLTYCNTAYAKIFGYDKSAELIGKSIYDLYPEEIVYKIIANNLLVIDTQMEHSLEEEIVVGEKSRVYASIKRPYHLGKKQVGILGLSREKSTREISYESLKEANENLENYINQSILSLATLTQKITGKTNAHISENPVDYLMNVKEYYENLIAAIPINLYWINREGVYMGCSDLQAKTINLPSRKEIAGKTNTELHLEYNGVRPEKVDLINEEVMGSGITRTLEETHIPFKGSSSDYLSTKTPLFDEKGNVIGMLGASMDITAQKEAERLRIAKEKLEAADQLKTDYLANVFHDVRTPINWIYGAVDTLKNGGLESWEVERKYDLMEHAANLIIRMTDDISDVTKVESNDLLVKPTWVDLSSLISSLEEHICYYKTSDTILQFDTFFDRDNPYFVQLDGVRVFQVLMNLLTNACKSIDDRGFVTFSCDLKEDRLYFAVEDSGRGIPKDKLETIFQRYRKINQHVTGKGIGLTISQRIVQLMGDDIHVSSKEGEGSTFSFSIPFIPKETDPSRKIVPLSNYPNWKDKTVLIVEDIQENFELLHSFLEPTGCNIIHAKNGKSAIELFKNNPNIALVLLDIGLPDMSGKEVLKEIKKQRIDTPVITQTAFTVSAKKEELLQAGVEDFITKPIDAKSIIDSMERSFLE